MTSPLLGTKVLDLTHVLAGPFSTYMLAVHGADVLKIEDLQRPDGVRERGADARLNQKLVGTNYLTQGAHKRAMTLNLKPLEGQHIFRTLARDVDIVVEKCRADAMAELGLDYEQLSETNPKLIYCSMAGFGHGGPRSEINTYDNTVQAASGLMVTTGHDVSDPIKIGASIIDYAQVYLQHLQLPWQSRNVRKRSSDTMSTASCLVPR